jgi:hypothetical protein
MPSEEVILRRNKQDGMWNIHSPKGHIIAGGFRGSQYNATEWAKRFISAWLSWVLVIEEEDHEA